MTRARSTALARGAWAPGLVLVLAGALLLAACGSRLSDDQLRAAQGGASGGRGVTSIAIGSGPIGTDPSAGGGGSADDSGAGVIGTLTSGCSPDKATGTLPAGTPGVTADTIRIGMISDRAGAIPVPTVGMEESFKAFVAFCNAHGGIHGRRLDLHTYDSGVFKDAEATKQACGDDLFALVGSGSAQDQQGAQTRVDCGLPEVPGYTATVQRGMSDDLVQPLPSQGPVASTGACQYLAKRFPQAVKKVASLYASLDAARNHGLAWEEGCKKAAGYQVVYSKGVPPLYKDWGPIVSDLKERGVRYVTMVSDASSMLALLKAMNDQGFRPDVIDLGQQYYDPQIAADPNAEGAFVLANTAPFEDTSNVALKQYRSWLAKAAPGAAPTSLGVQSFSAGLLFAQAASALGNDLTRAGLLTQLRQIHQWDGGGLQMPSDPPSNETPRCFVYLRVHDGHFVREHPTQGFDCSPRYATPLTGDYGSGAKRTHG